MKRKIIAVLLALCALSAFAADKDAGKVYKIKIGYVQNDKDPLTQGLVYLADQLKARTNGRIKVEVMASGILGDTPEVLQQAQAGMDVGLLVDAGRFADYVPELMIFDAPYLFKDFKEANKFAQSDMFKGWTDKVIPSGVRICSWNWYQGPRNFWTQKPIKSMADMKNLKIRTGSSPMWQATVDALGAKPVSLAMGETYMGIQQMVVDGCELQTPGAYGAKMHEVAKYMTRTSHFQLLTGMAVSEAWFKKLPADLQKIFLEECVKAGEYASNVTLSNITRMESEMVSKGLKISDIDITPLVKATEKAYSKFKGFPELRTKIRQIVEK